MISPAEIKAIMEAVAETVGAKIDEIRESLDKRISAIDEQSAVPGPKGEQGDPGRDGEPGKDGKDGDPGRDGEPGKNGIDGKSITVADVLPEIEKMQASWALDFERRAQDILHRAVESIPKPQDGKDGQPGAPGINGKDGVNGKDGFSLDDFSIEYDGERTISFSFRGEKGTLTKEFSFPVVIDRGIFKDGSNYQKGDGVTSGGSFWIAQRGEELGRPGLPDSGWRLAVKKGRDGKDGEKGKAGEQGPQGRPGNDLTKMGI